MEKKKPDYRGNQTSAKDQDAQTPPWLLRAVSDRVFGGRPLFDPCPPNWETCGLARTWRSPAYVNPPFSSALRWLLKASHERVHAVVLLPLHKLQRSYFAPVREMVRRVWLLRELVKFRGYKKPLNKAVVLVEFGGEEETEETEETENAEGRTREIMWWTPSSELAEEAWRAVREAVPSAVRVDSWPSKAVPAIVARESYCVFMPSRLDLQCIRHNLDRVDLVVLGPYLRPTAGAPRRWTPSMVIARGESEVRSLRALGGTRVPAPQLTRSPL